MTAPTIEYGQLEQVDIHFDDLDLMGNVHNARYAVLIERAISLYWTRLGYGYDSSGANGLLAVAEFTINYRVPVTQLGPIGVHFWVERLGRSSCVYGYRVVSADGMVTHADGKRVMIQLDARTRRPAPWPSGTRAVAEALLIPVPVSGPVEERAQQG